MQDLIENRPGFQKTEAGWIPSDWQPVTVSDTGRVVTGSTPATGNPAYYGGSHLFAAPSDLGDCRYVVRTQTTLTQSGFECCRQLPKDSVLFVCIGSTIGKVGLAGAQLATNQQINAVIVNDKCSPQYVYYALLHRSQYIASLAACQAVPIVNKTEFEHVHLPLPPLSEQRKIAEIISTCDDAIERTHDLIAAKKQQKKALMQHLLIGKKRLPDFGNPEPRTPYRFFDLPSDWTCPRIHEIARERAERNRNGDKYPVLSCSKHLGFIESSQYFGKQVFSEDTSNYKIIRRGWFGYPSNHIEEGSIGLLEKHEAGIVSPIYTVFETGKEVDLEYLYAILKTETYRHIFETSTNASVDRRGSLRWNAFSHIRVPLPSVDEQGAIAEVLRTADMEIAKLEVKQTCLKHQKKGLMQKLLTGQIRVKV